MKYERVEDKFAFLAYGESHIMLEEINENCNTDELKCPFDRGINFQIATNDAYKIAYNLKRNNITMLREIVESQYKCDGKVIVEKEIILQDADGYLLRISQNESE